jgi:hypothetical protein
MALLASACGCFPPPGTAAEGKYPGRPLAAGLEPVYSMAHNATALVSPLPPSPSIHRRPLVAPALIPPVITTAAMAALLGVARVYDSLPLQLPPCGLRTLTGIPCIGCGGTRAMRALAQGDLIGALAFNPLVFIAACAVPIWLASAWIRHRRFPDTAPLRPIPLPWIVVGLIAILAANWIYLICFLPQ